MAEAGSVAPVFRDEGYVATATYDFYHAIIYNNKLYFCRQDGTIGHEPQESSDEYWFLSLDGNIADAATLNGKSESELSVGNSSALGDETAEEWQGKIDAIQTTSSATLSGAGWYRVAECDYAAAGGYGDCVELRIKRVKHTNNNEQHTLLIRSIYLNQDIVSLNSKSNIHIITKVRYTYDTAKGYLEIYYNANTTNRCLFEVSHAQNADYTWQAITPTLTEETVEGVTVTKTYDIPANAKPVTDLDLSEHYYNAKTLYTVAEVDEYFNTVSANMANGISYRKRFSIGVSNHTIFTAGIYEIFGYKQSAVYEWQIVVGYFGKKFYRAKDSGTWSEWEVDATTADLANYFPVTGGKINGTVMVGAKSTVPMQIENTDGTEVRFRYMLNGSIMGYLGFETSNKPLFINAGGYKYPLLHSGNVGSYALPIGGGTVGNGTVAYPMFIMGHSSAAILGFVRKDKTGLGYLGISDSKGPHFLNADRTQDYALHHDGNSAKVVQATSAPSDTTAVWVDTANKVTKIYIDGAWTALA